MAEYLIQDTTLTNIAAPIKTLMGLTDNLTTDEMVSNLNDANTAVANALVALTEKEVVVPNGSNVTDLADLIESIEADGAGELFHAEITPATSGEVLTFEVGEIGERIAAVIASLKPGDYIGTGKNYAVSHIATLNQEPVSSKPRAVYIVSYQDGVSTYLSKGASIQNSGSTPNGTAIHDSYSFWNSGRDKPLVKFYVTNGAESKYGLLVGKTYDIWVIKEE